MKHNKNFIGSNFNEFLDELGILDECLVEAEKRIFVKQIKDLMKEKHMTKTILAEKMNTSRASLDRLLDVNNDSMTLKTFVKISKIFDKRLVLRLEDKENIIHNNN